MKNRNCYQQRRGMRALIIRKILEQLFMNILGIYFFYNKKIPGFCMYHLFALKIYNTDVDILKRIDRHSQNRKKSKKVKIETCSFSKDDDNNHAFHVYWLINHHRILTICSVQKKNQELMQHRKYVFTNNILFADLILTT